MAGDDTTQDQTAYDQLGLTPQQRSLIGYNTIGSIGALLLAAGQKMSPQDRAKYLAQLGNVPTQMSQQIDAATQSRVRQQQLAQIAAQAALMKGQLANLPIEAQLKQAQISDFSSQAALRAAQAKHAEQMNRLMEQAGQMFGGIPAVNAAPTSAANPTAAPAANATPVLSPAQEAVVAPLSQPAANSAGQPANAAPLAGGAQSAVTGTQQGALTGMDPHLRAMMMMAAAKGDFGAVSKIIEQFNEFTAKQNNEPITVPVINPHTGVATKHVISRADFTKFMADLRARGLAAGVPEYNEEQNARLKALGEYGTQLDEGRRGAVELNGRLSQMEGALPGFRPGRGAQQYYDAAAWLNSYLPGSFLPDGMGADKVSSYQQFQKLATQYATEQARKLGAREAASVVNIVLQSNPNAEMTPDALRRIMGGLRAQNDYAVAKANAADAWRSQHAGTLEGFDTNWKTRPEQFLVPYLSTADIKTMPTEVLRRMQLDTK